MGGSHVRGGHEEGSSTGRGHWIEICAAISSARVLELLPISGPGPPGQPRATVAAAARLPIVGTAPASSARVAIKVAVRRRRAGGPAVPAGTTIIPHAPRGIKRQVVGGGTRVPLPVVSAGCARCGGARPCGGLHGAPVLAVAVAVLAHRCSPAASLPLFPHALPLPGHGRGARVAEGRHGRLQSRESCQAHGDGGWPSAILQRRVRPACTLLLLLAVMHSSLHVLGAALLHARLGCRGVDES